MLAGVVAAALPARRAARLDVLAREPPVTSETRATALLAEHVIEFPDDDRLLEADR